LKFDVLGRPVATSAAFEFTGHRHVGNSRLNIVPNFPRRRKRASWRQGAHHVDFTISIQAALPDPPSCPPNPVASKQEIKDRLMPGVDSPSLSSLKLC
jgi:hypothetical protein